MQTKTQALEAYLVASARAGDTASMARLVEMRGPRLLAHAARLVGDGEVARDIVQEAWVEILRGLNGMRNDAAFLPWALRIVSRRVAREIGRRQKARRLETDYAAEAETETPAAELTALDAAKVRAAIAALSPEQSATVALFYLEEMSVAQVAASLDVPIGTVKTRLMHARAKLRRALEEDET